MSRYIDLDEFLENEGEAYMNAQIKLAKENADKTIDATRYINQLVHKKLLMLIADTPSIDIVRCKECRHWKWIEWAKEYRCTLRNTAFNARADDFCSYGERENDEKSV